LIHQNEQPQMAPSSTNDTFYAAMRRPFRVAVTG
jgi:hypothetical protein